MFIEHAGLGVLFASGQLACIILDTFTDDEIGGRVTDIDLLGTSGQGIVSYGAQTEIDPTDLPIRPQMTAAIEIVAQRLDHVLVVPNRASCRDSDGSYVEVAEA